MTRISKTRKVKKVKSCKKTVENKSNYKNEGTYDQKIKKMSMNDAAFR